MEIAQYAQKQLLSSSMKLGPGYTLQSVRFQFDSDWRLLWLQQILWLLLLTFNMLKGLVIAQINC